MKKEDEQRTPDTTAAGLVLRMTWLLAGPFALFVVAGHTAINAHGAYTAADAAYAGIVLVMILAKLLDVTKLAGSTAEGVPATMTDFARYAGLSAVGSFALWMAAHLLGAALA